MITETRNRHSDPTNLGWFSPSPHPQPNHPGEISSPWLSDRGLAWAPAVRRGAQNFFLYQKYGFMPTSLVSWNLQVVFVSLQNPSEPHPAKVFPASGTAVISYHSFLDPLPVQLVKLSGGILNAWHCAPAGMLIVPGPDIFRRTV